MLLLCHQSRGEACALQQGCAECQLWKKHAQLNRCRGAPRNPFLCPAPKEDPPRASEQSDMHRSPIQREALARRKILGKSAGGSANPNLHLLCAQLEMPTKATAKQPIPLPEGMWAPTLLLDGKSVLWRARAWEHHRKIL